MTKQLRVTPHSVPAVKLPTEFAELNVDLSVFEKSYTDCAGCENVDAADSVLSQLSTAIAKHRPLTWDHWNPQDSNLRGKIAKLHGISVDQVLLTAGAIAGIDYCFKTFAMPKLNQRVGTKVGQLKPDWSGFDHYVDFYHCRRAYVENMKFPFVVNDDQIIEFVQQTGLDMMIFANPVPVNGSLISAAGVERILQACPETMFIIDEADTVSPSKQAAHLANDYDNVVFLGSLSKFYGLSGYRIGYLVTNKKLAGHFRRTINPVELSGPAIYAGNIIMDDVSYQEQTQRNVAESIAVLQSACDDTGYDMAASPDCFACYLYSETGDPKEELWEHGIKILPGQYFGLPEEVSGGRFNLSDPAKAKLAAEKIRLIHGC